ncbi:MAG: hypothetical protein GXP09_07745 [Gammaproteobacteria bacterium]|nr:hypothetical protein [Gammaproteobacteria bacterium]
MTEVRDIEEVIAVNEAAKRIMDTSHKVYLIALNAMFMARKVDGSAAGFTTVTTALRVFSDHLNEGMSALSQVIYDLVGSMAVLLKLQRYTRYLSRARGSDRTSLRARMVQKVLDRRIAELETAYGGFVSTRRKVQRDLERASKLCDMGEILAVLAKIESTSAGSLAHSLNQVSEEIEQTVAAIDKLLQQAIACLDEAKEQQYIAAEEGIAA